MPKLRIRSLGDSVLGDRALGDRTLYENLRDVTQELYQFVSRMQKPNLEDIRWLAGAQARCESLANEIAAMQARLGLQTSSGQISLVPTLENVLENLREYLKELEGSPNARRLRKRFRELSSAYEELVVQIRYLRSGNLKMPRSDYFASVKPSNYARNAFHLAMGLGSATLYQFVLTYQQAMVICLIVLGIAIAMEVSRRYSTRVNTFLSEWVFGLIARPREKKHTNSATYYVLALTLITFFYPKPAVLIAVLVLAFADPAAALVGKKWGVKKIWREKSWVGTTTFFGVAFLVSLAYLIGAGPQLAFSSQFGLAFTVGLAGAVAELFSGSLDDNLTVPLLCGGVAALWL